MAAPNEKELYKLRKYMEAAAKTVLENLGLRVLTQRSTKEQTTPVVGVQYTGGQSLPDVTPIKASGADAPGPWSGTLEFEIATNREENAADHEDYVAEIRREMNERALRDRLQNREAFEPSELPYHEVQQIVEQSETPSIDDDLGDITRLSYNLVISIRIDAWP